MKLALCNEVLAGRPLAEQCRLAAALGYQGLELAPFTLADDPATLTEREAAGWRDAASAHGLSISSLHWLLVKPAGLSLTSDDAAVRGRTLEVLRRLIGLAAAAGVVYCIEPLGPAETPVVNTVAQAAALVDRIGCGRRLLHRAARARRDACRQHRGASGGAGGPHRLAGVAHDARHERGEPVRNGAICRHPAPVSGERAHRARAVQRPQPARAGPG
jgi:sugar phosphate isomerase/epimerase